MSDDEEEYHRDIELYYTICVESDLYLWLRSAYRCKTVWFTREELNKIAIKYNFNPYEYKTKRLLADQILSMWEIFFVYNEEFRKEYENYWGRVFL